MGDLNHEFGGIIAPNDSDAAQNPYVTLRYHLQTPEQISKSNLEAYR